MPEELPVTRTDCTERTLHGPGRGSLGALSRAAALKRLVRAKGDAATNRSLLKRSTHAQAVRPSLERTRSSGAAGLHSVAPLGALALELRDQELRVEGGDQVLERLRAGFEHLHHPLGLDLPRQAAHHDLDLLLD